ncbi:MAG: phosphoribosylpyrophosphate synthetase [Flavobacteriales bacterium]|nr:phosphoribosylpyrophosphate synthetase [Flavobacteriales bacterium]MBP9080189.1 phosphoribosylpyrophosphate synthetase [Flavobacteriales bacterium]
MVRAYDTLSLAVNDLIARGYTDELTLHQECLICNGNNTSLHPDEFTIDEFHRFEGDSNPSDESIVYAISSEKHHVKGVLVNAFGPRASSLNQAMVAKLATHR